VHRARGRLPRLPLEPDERDETDLGRVEPSADGSWRIPLDRPPIYQDWLLVLEAG